MPDAVPAAEAPPPTQSAIELGAISFTVLVASIEAAVPPISLPAQVQLYRNWLAAGGGRAGDAYAAWFNIGVIYSQNGDRASAIVAYRCALSLKPDLGAASVNLGLALEATGAQQAALELWSSSLQPDRDQTALLNHQGRLLEQLGRLQEAERLLSRSLRIDPLQPDVIQHWVHLRQKMCLWPVISPACGMAYEAVQETCGPLSVLALSDDVDLQRRVTATWISRKTVACSEHLAPSCGYRHRRIRIGYVSSDFCRHAMSYLIVELFEQHDRAQFDVFGYCSSREDGSDVRRRVLASFDTVRQIGQLTDEQAARMIRADEIDILIDLNGLTAGSRLQIMRWRPAPLQASYLGFVGPLPLPELDALICDDVVVPPEQAHAYLPRPLPIAGLYQANERHRAIGDGLTRDMAGLDPNAFVFCCFCGHFKITPSMFDAWMEILKRVPESVLWLVDDNPWSRASMQRRAEEQGVDPERLVFAERCAPDVYMARLKLADLFLDTTPYNAGTVASDAIRMELPIVTLPGRSFASRMAARLLDAYGTTKGVASSISDYIERAVGLALEPTAYAQHRTQFSADRWAVTLGDSAGFARSFERALLSRMEEQGLA